MFRKRFLFLLKNLTFDDAEIRQEKRLLCGFSRILSKFQPSVSEDAST